MAEEINVTTVRLSKKAHKIKMELAPVFGLKNILSAGLILFSNITSEQQKRIITEANGKEIESKSKPEDDAPSDDDLDEEIRNLARSFAILTKKLEHRAAAISQKKTRRRKIV